MASNIFGASLSGMNAAQYGLSTTQHNIANANTPGYTRQSTILSAQLAQSTGFGFVGQGVAVTGVVRAYDQFLTSQVRQEQSQASYLSTYLASIKQIDNMIADPAAGVSPAIQDFFSATNGMANAPESIPARQSVLSTAQSAVNRFQAMDQRLTDISNSLTGQLTGSIQNVNTYAAQISTLNTSIKNAVASAQPGQQPNDLLDQRDQIINLLNKEIKVTVQPQTDGSLNVFIGNGQALVVGEQVMGLQGVQNPSDPSKVDVAYLYNGKTITLQQSSLQGGNLGAYLTFRDQTLEPARNALGRVAIGLATSINQQNQMGQDLNGALGGNIFNAAAPRVSVGANNTGGATVSATISSVSALTTSDYQLKFDGTNYSMTRLTDNVVTSLGATLPGLSVDGISASIATGAMNAGDSFLIRPTANAARDIAVMTTDPNKLATAAPMRASAALGNTGTGAIAAGTVNTPLPLNANLQAPVSITFTSPTTFDVVGAGTGNPVGLVYPTASGNITYNGWTTQITGAPAAGDVFNMASNTTATGDNRNALLMAAMQTQNLLANGTTSFQGAYSQLVGSIGAKTSELTVTSLAQDAMVTQTVANQQSVSGVNLDEEAANLIRYQRAYQAAAKAMQIANTMFDSLLTLGR